ncbi:DUF1287 domain-containing protein [Saccharobesus litoralis]|uniref:DUF1287 domain-containing protein n=1 Tax=Saccharobesus litoralis TaxID=2172099 RepID=A0A2S0VR29_9ALTE|nr:DUF1287 domain-containing protein [Saccharobesus litoralis]AWB66654.1 DUF1287 domain-containing protein [Saccharobesus litoralis]
MLRLTLSPLVLLTVCTFSHASQVYSADSLVKAAKERTRHKVTYDGRYLKIDYPNGDVPENIGVCTDVVIRSYRGIGIDLQQLVHEDMRSHFNQYPSKRIWGLTRTDRNIDHRRVPNLQTFFSRHGTRLTVSNQAKNYLAGDLVTWVLPGNLPHIGIVIDNKDPDSGNPLIVHNVGLGPQIEDFLFEYPISGHYRYMPKPSL